MQNINYLFLLFIILFFLVLFVFLINKIHLNKKINENFACNDLSNSTISSSPLNMTTQQVINSDDVRNMIFKQTGWFPNPNVEYPWFVDPNNKKDVKESEQLTKNTNTFSLCSKACCSQQWFLPFNPGFDKQKYSKYIPTDYTCNNGYQDVGCLCMDKKQVDFISSRGNNA